MRSSKTLWITIAAAALSLSAVFAFAWAGWPGESNGCREQMRPICFCERPRGGLVAQPANTFSNFGFVAVGLWIAVVTDRRPRPDRRNPLTETSLYPTIFAVATALLGPGSMFLHASLTVWGGLLDVASMYLFGGLAVAYGTGRLFSLSTSMFLAIFFTLVSGLVGVQATLGLPVEATFGVLLIASVALEWAISRRGRQLSIDRRFVGLALGSFLTAFAIWLPSLTGGPLCDPESWIQGHGVWHLLCAVAAGSLFAYYRSEHVAAAGAAP